MAAVLFSELGSPEKLPDVCVCCGKPAIWREEVSFTWMPYLSFHFGLIGLPFVAANLASKRRFRLSLPACEIDVPRLHFSETVAFLGRLVIMCICGTVLSMSGLFVLVIQMAMEVSQQVRNITGIAFGIAFLFFSVGGLMLLLLWAFVGMVFCLDLPKVEAVEYPYFQLQNVHPLFAEEVERRRMEELGAVANNSGTGVVEQR